MTDKEKIAAYVMSGQQRDKLTPQQRRVVKLRAEGNTLKAIAFDLKLSVKTVEYYWQQAVQRIGLSDVALVTQWALKYGLASWVV